MKTILTFLLLVCLGFSKTIRLTAQTYTTQAELDQFDPNLTEINSYVTISGNDITNLDALSNIVSFGNNASVYIRDCPALTNIDGLSNLFSLSGRLILARNEKLNNIDALSQLVSINGTLDLDSNPALTNINGLVNVGSISGRLIISRCPLLTDVDALSNLVSVTGLLEISNCESLTNIDGLSNAESFTDGLTLTYNEKLTNIDGLVKVTAIDDFTISNNDLLTDIDGLANVRSIPGNLNVSNNPSMTNIDALSKVLSIEGGVTISYNESLATIDGLSGVTSISGYLTVGNNKTLTNIDALEKLSSIEGRVSIGYNESLATIDGLSGVTSISGYLTVGNNKTLTNIDALEKLSSIEGNVTISYNESLANIDGFENVSSVPGTLIISNNNSLTNISALKNISSIEGRVTISYNEGITTVDGLVGLSMIPGNLTISNNEVLGDIDGLTNVISVSGYLNIEGNSALANIDGLGNLTSVEGNLNIRRNQSLINITGLNTLTTIAGRVSIERNEALSNIDGLGNITSIPGHLIIEYNDGLTDVDGLSMLSSISGSLSIGHNESLTNISGLANLPSLEGNLTIRSNDALLNIDALDNLTAIEGSLYLQYNDSLIDIIGLSNITSVNGRLNIENNTSLSNVDGLANVRSVDGSLSIERNSVLTNISGLTALTSIEGTVSIERNNTLANIDGLSNLSSLDGRLEVSWNEALIHIDGLSNLTSIVGYLALERNGSLANIEGLSNVTTLPGNVRLNYNNSLSNIDGLANLNSVEGYLSINDCDALTNLNGLANLTSIGGNLYINSNSVLTNIEGLENVETVAGSVTLNYNELLSECCILLPLIEDPSQHNLINIYNNAEGCNTIDEILESTCGISVDHTSNPPCLGANNGSIDITVSNFDTSPFTYIWEETVTNDTGTGTSQEENFSIQQLSSGTYNITITVPDGDEAILENILLDAIASSSLDILQVTSENAAFGLDNGSLSIAFSGGQAPYSVSLVGPSNRDLPNITGTSVDLSGLYPGEYTFFIYDANNQSASLEITLIDEDISTEDCAEPMDIIILNLVSTAISAEEYKQSKDYFKDFYEGINLGLGSGDSRVAFAEWSGRGQNEIKIGITGDDFLLEEYHNLERSYTGGTDILDALQFGNDYLQANARPHAQKVIIFTFDGCASFSAAAYAEELKETGIIIADVGIGYVNSSSSYRQLLIKAATTADMAYFANDFSQLDPLEMSVSLAYANCSGTSANFYFNRDGQITLDDYVPVGSCPYPGTVEVSFTISTTEQLSLPTGTPVSFYHNDPTRFGASLISTFIIPCSIPAGETESFSTTLPIETATQLYVVLNDGGHSSPAFDLPVTDIVETTYANNIDSENICVDQYATLQALKSSVSLYPICENIVQYTIDVCNISGIDASAVTIQDDPPANFDLVESVVNTNGCSTSNSDTYDIPAGCCVSMTLSYDVSSASQGLYGESSVTIDGPSGQTYLDFDGSNTTTEDILLNGQQDCGDPTVTFRKEVNHQTTCSDHSLTYTYYIDNKSSTPLYGLRFIDILPKPLEWVYKPYDKNGLSISTSQSVEGQTASFVIDQIDAETVATFIIDVYVGETDVEVIATSAATLQGFPGYINNGIDALETNETTTTVLGDIEINLIETITLKPTENTVELDAIISESAAVLWTTSGDGVFSDSEIASPTYTLGEEDLLDSLVGLFISVSTYCGQKGVSVLIERECELAFERLRPIEICVGETHSTTLTWTGGVGPYTLTETNTDLGMETSFDLDDIPPGVHTYILEDAQGCRSRTEVTLEEMLPPDADVLISCQDLEYYEVEIAAGDFSIATDLGLTIDDLGAGNYIIKNIPLSDTLNINITDGLTGCENARLITPPDCACAALVFVSDDQIISCFEETVLLDGSESSNGARFSVAWYDEDRNVLSTEHNYEVEDAGLYVLEVTDTDNGCAVSDSVQVSDIRNEPIAVILSDETALTCSVSTLELSMTKEQNVNYSWTHVESGVDENGDLVLIDAPGEIRLTAQDTITGCVSQTSMMIALDTATLAIILGEPLILNCENEQVILDAGASDLSSGYELNWLDSDFAELTSTAATITTDQPGNYYLQLENTSNDCISMDSVVVLEDRTIPVISIDANMELACADDFVNVEPSSISAGEHSFVWSNNDQLLGQENYLEVTTAGTYILETKHKLSECVTSDTIVVTTPDGITGMALQSSDPLCYDLPSGSISIEDIYGGTPGYSYFLNDELLAGTVQNELGAGEYELIVEDAMGCEFDTLIYLVEPPAIRLQSDQAVSTVNEGADVLVQLTTDLQLEDIGSVNWEPVIPCDNCLEYLFENVTEDLAYTVTIIDKNGCEEALELRVNVDRELRLYLPNVLSNKDDEDNIFFIQSAISNLFIEELSIYDRWGNKVFEQIGVPANNPLYGWDGSYKGEKVMAGVYTYNFVASYKEEQVRFAGSVTYLK